MKFLHILAAASLSFVLASGANAQQQSELTCELVKSPTQSDAGFKRIGIRAPKANVNGQRVTAMPVQIAMPANQARMDSALEQPKIVEIYDCKGQTAFKVKSEPLPEHDATEILVPETLPKGTKIQVCSKSVGCATGVFEDFGKWVDLKVPAAGDKSPATKVSGKYN